MSQQENSEGMTEELKRKLCTIKAKNGKHYLYMPDGTEVPYVNKTEVIDEARKGAYAIIRLRVNLE